MSKHSKIPFFLIVLALTAVAACDEKQSENAEKTSKKLRKEILKEIASLKEHPWAGEYYEGDGLGVNVLLTIAPKSGYVFEWHGCMGLYDRNYGAVEWKGEQINLSFTFKNEREGFQGIAKRLVPVAWGPRIYLIPAEDKELIGFCNEVNEGSEPRQGMHGSYLLRRGDEKKKAAGLPAVPEKYLPYLLKEPITAEIIEVGKTVKHSEGDWKEQKTVVTLNRGKAAGLLPGMKLYPNDLHFGTDVTITKVEEDKAEGVAWQMGKEESAPKVGWKLSTIPPWHTKEEKGGDL